MSIDSPTTAELSTAQCEPEAQIALEALFVLLQTRRPTLRQLWAAMDFVWDAGGADNRNPTDDALAKFYGHPVWLLNGLFIEQHEESLRYREKFADWVASVHPKRVADVGGGYGTLARKIAEKSPLTSVEIVEPFPRREAIGVNKSYPNVRFVPKFSGLYDVVLATDVFEHVQDPLELLFSIGPYVAPTGYILTANHFAPSIKCHLPGTFHFEETWSLFMTLAGFREIKRVEYATVSQKFADKTLTTKVRRTERISRVGHRRLRGFPGAGGLRRLLTHFSAAMP